MTFLSGFAKVAQALVLHDEPALSGLLTSRSSEDERWVYAAPFFDELQTAQAARAKSDPALHATSRVVISALPDGAHLPASLVVGEVDGGRVILVPSRHPGARTLVGELEAQGGDVRPL